MLWRNEGVDVLGADERVADEDDGDRCRKVGVLLDRGAVVRADGLTRCCVPWDRSLRKDEAFPVVDRAAVLVGRV